MHSDSPGVCEAIGGKRLKQPSQFQCVDTTLYNLFRRPLVKIQDYLSQRMSERVYKNLITGFITGPFPPHVLVQQLLKIKKKVKYTDFMTIHVPRIKSL